MITQSSLSIDLGDDGSTPVKTADNQFCDKDSCGEEFEDPFAENIPPVKYE